ncbi:MAG: hypothetical protein DRN71_00080 [Candidatus Nanohalarchaeota archaeon]|nr:MAG: hypothetical protein DRN71_00080 [Candidatus Nanohaloarchaeota archaeon]
MTHNEFVIENYNKWIDKNPGIGIMGYGSEQSQDIRFGTLFKAGDMAGKTILDVGCGRGDFAAKLVRSGVKYKRYLGIDIVPQMIDIAKKANSSENVEFRVLDILACSEKLSFDYVIMCGPLNLRTPHTEETAKKLIRKAYEIAKIGVAFNMTSILGDEDKKTDHTYYFDPFDVLRFCAGMTRNLWFDHTYLPHDFTVFMYRKGEYEL